MRFLLDVNVLVALAFPLHSSHQAAHSWFRREPDRLWATCPLTQAGFLRVASRALGGSRDATDLSDSQRSRLIGPNQIADMQLLLLAHRHRAQLATFDSGLKELALGTRYAS